MEFLEPFWAISKLSHAFHWCTGWSPISHQKVQATWNGKVLWTQMHGQINQLQIQYCYLLQFNFFTLVLMLIKEALHLLQTYKLIFCHLNRKLQSSISKSLSKFEYHWNQKPGHWLVMEGILEAGLEVSYIKLNISVTQYRGTGSLWKAYSKLD